jgi:hypothetical protein
LRTGRDTIEAVSTLAAIMRDTKTLSEVQRYTNDADRKRLAESGMAKRREQSVNTTVEPGSAECRRKHGVRKLYGLEPIKRRKHYNSRDGQADWDLSVSDNVAGARNELANYGLRFRGSSELR